MEFYQMAHLAICKPYTYKLLSHPTAKLCLRAQCFYISDTWLPTQMPGVVGATQDRIFLDLKGDRGGNQEESE